MTCKLIVLVVSSVLKSCCWNEFQAFCENNYLWAVIMLIPFAWWHHQNKKICIYLNAGCFCLFYKLLLTWISRFWWNQPWHLWSYNHVDAYCVLTSSEQGYFPLFECWLPMFISWTVADMKLKVFVEASIYEPTMRLILIPQWHHQNREVCVCLNVDCLYLLCCWHEW